MGRFEIREDFYLNGAPFKIISGSIHYFRVPPAYWRDRLEKLRYLGCNTVETYVPWNLHEPVRGRFCFDGWLDLAAFLRLAQELGLYAIVRPSPYICAEWEFGGLPAWLLCVPGMRLRSVEGPFLDCVADYYRALFPVLTPLQIDCGGPIILMQVENEYGAYGDDKAYLTALKTLMEKGGTVVPLVTSDGPWKDYLACGSLPGVLATANFGSKTAQQFAALRAHIGTGPLMCMEFWDGWFDHWGCGVHHTTDPHAGADDLDEALRQGSVNLYMFHGGTNFGFMNGANDTDRLMPDVTSYDYDAPLSEDGRMTEKYECFRAVIGKHAPLPDTPPPAPIPRQAYGPLAWQARCALGDGADAATPVDSVHPISMEGLAQSYGYVLYCTQIPPGRTVESIRLFGAGDRAQVFLDGSPVLTLYDRALRQEHAVQWDGGQAGRRLTILVENMGRVNYGHRMTQQHKGIFGEVLLDGRIHTGWRQYALPLDAAGLDRLAFCAGAAVDAPAFYRFDWTVDTPADTFLDLTGWGKGCVFLNRFNLGRFWSIGPQKRLYIPAPLLRQGKNELIVFETEGVTAPTVSLWDEPNLG